MSECETSSVTVWGAPFQADSLRRCSPASTSLVLDSVYGRSKLIPAALRRAQAVKDGVPEEENLSVLDTGRTP